MHFLLYESLGQLSILISEGAVLTYPISAAPHLTLMSFSVISGPKNLEVVKTSTTSVIVQWEEAQGEIDRYILSVSPNQTDGSVKGEQEIKLLPRTDSAQIDGLEPGHLYDISLVAEKDGTRSLPATAQATPGEYGGEVSESINTGLFQHRDEGLNFL